jgi:hypothetical protein
MEKYLITGEVYENKKLYALFFTGKYFVCDLGKLNAVSKPTDLDLKIIRKLNDNEFKEKILKYKDNFWYSLNIEDEDKTFKVSNIKCYRDPVLISYEYEHFKSLMEI